MRRLTWTVTVKQSISCLSPLLPSLLWPHFIYSLCIVTSLCPPLLSLHYFSTGDSAHSSTYSQWLLTVVQQACACGEIVTELLRVTLPWICTSLTCITFQYKNHTCIHHVHIEIILVLKNYTMVVSMNHN